ncbi:hypothetical protein RFI_20473, partial [Reticulomyxa filosa]
SSWHGQRAFGVLALPVMKVPVINSLRVNPIAMKSDMYGIVLTSWGDGNYSDMYKTQLLQIGGNLLANCVQHFPCRYHYFLRLSHSVHQRVYNIPLIHAHTQPQMSSAFVPFLGNSSSSGWQYSLLACVESRFGGLNCAQKYFDPTATPLLLHANTDNCTLVTTFTQSLLTLLINAQDSIKLAQLVTALLVELDFFKPIQACTNQLVPLLINVISQHLLTEYFDY